MDKRYKDLFTLITQSVANLAEQVMNLHNKNNEEKEATVAQTMRDDYLDLHDKLEDENQSLNKADYARLLVGTIIVTTQLENKIKNEQNALQGYKIDIIPKLDQINNTTDDATAVELAENLFKISSEVETEENQKVE